MSRAPRDGRDEVLTIRDVAVLDCTGREPAGRMDVTLRSGVIGSLRPAGRAPSSQEGETIDGAGCTLMPGLTDAHVHFALIGPGGDHGTDPWVFHALRVARYIESALDEGFTTVRDAGGLDPAWARAVSQGLIRGPTILPSGSVLSQTGGHGDLRAQHEAVHRAGSIPGLVALPEVVDGVDGVRRAAREQLRRGATQVKLLASGGIVSPVDPFESIQFSHEEIAAAVEVASNWGTYVMAHCHTSAAINAAIEAGVRSIEHGSVLDSGTAEAMAARGTFMVPTLQALEMLAAHPERWSLAPQKVARLNEIAGEAGKSVRTADAAGVAIGSGSDVVGPWQGRRGEEIVLKAQHLGVHDAIISATRTNAELFGMGERIGTVEEGKAADLILVAGNPLDDVEILAQPDCIPVVIKAGVIAKDAERRLEEG